MNNKYGISEEYAIAEDGPLFSLLLRQRLFNTPFRLVTMVFCITWLPLFILSFLEGSLVSGVQRPFLYDIAMQARILVALPMLVLLKSIVNQRLSVTSQHLCNSLLDNEERQKIIKITFPRARKLTNSVITEIILILIVVAATTSMVNGGFYSALGNGITSWMTTHQETHLKLSMAGRWSVFVSIPVIQFFIGRWIWRYIVWVMFLFRLSKSKLDLLPTHADNAGGLGVIMLAQRSFNIFFIAMGVIFSGELISQLLINPDAFDAIRNEVVAYIIFCVIVLTVPAAFFTSKLSEVRTQGLLHLSKLSTSLSQKFEREWVNNKPVEAILEKQEIDPSMVFDYNGIYESFHKLNVIPVTTNDFIGIAGFLFIPFIPILFVRFSISELLQGIVGTLL